MRAVGAFFRFNQAVRQMTKDDACEAASLALKKAFALIS